MHSKRVQKISGKVEWWDNKEDTREVIKTREGEKIKSDVERERERKIENKNYKIKS